MPKNWSHLNWRTARCSDDTITTEKWNVTMLLTSNQWQDTACMNHGMPPQRLIPTVNNIQRTVIARRDGTMGHVPETKIAVQWTHAMRVWSCPDGLHAYCFDYGPLVNRDVNAMGYCVPRTMAKGKRRPRFDCTRHMAARLLICHLFLLAIVK